MFNPIRKFYMPDEVVGLKITTDAGPSISSMAELKKAIKDAQFEAAALAQKFGDTSPQAAAAAKKVAELNDVMADTNSLVNAFNPDRKFAAFSGAINAVTGGFSALTGAMALFGVESEEVQKTLLKVQAAMAISEGINNVLDGVQAFKNLSAVVQNSTVFIKANAAATAIAGGIMKLFRKEVDATSTSFKVLKATIAATGIGLLIVALGALVAAFNNVSDAAENATESQKRFVENTQNAAKAALDAGIRFNEQQAALEIARAKARGASEEEIFNIQQKWDKEKLAAKQRYYDDVGFIDKDAAAAVEDQALKNELSELNHITEQNAKKKSLYDQDAANKAAALSKKEQDEKDYNQRVFDKQFEFINSQREQLEADSAAKKEQDAADQQYRDEYQAKINEGEWNVVANAIAAAKEKEKTDKENAEATKRLEEEKTAARENAANIATNLLAQGSQLLGQHTAAGKVLAIAATTIDTYRGAMSAYVGMVEAIPGPVGIAAGAVAAAATVAIGIANVKKILAVKTPGSAAGGTAPSISTSAPLSAAVPAQRTSTTVDAASINRLGQASSKSYVLESDVSDNQQRMAMLNRAARIT